MKLPPLPMIDLARYATLPDDLQRKALERHKGGGGLWSYDPARNKSHDSFQAADPLGLQLPPVAWSQVAADIVRASTFGAEQRDSNLEVAKLVFDWVSENNVKAVDFRIPSLALGKIAHVRYWENLLFELNGARHALFLDHRRGNGLLRKSSNASRFVFSAMHHHVRSMDPAFSEYKMTIFRFPTNENGERTLDFYTDEGIDHFSFDQLDEMVARTYFIWREVCEERLKAGSKSDARADEPPFEKFWKKKA